MTVNANRVTSPPAAATDTSRSRANAGSRPTIRNSVVTITKAETASSQTQSAPPPAPERESGIEDEWDKVASRKEAAHLSVIKRNDAWSQFASLPTKIH